MIAFSAVLAPAIVALDRGGERAQSVWMLSIVSFSLVVFASLCVSDPTRRVNRSRFGGHEKSRKLTNLKNAALINVRRSHIRLPDTYLRYSPLVIAFAFTAMAFFQTIELPSSWLESFSPSTAAAYTKTFTELSLGEPNPRFSASLAPYLTDRYVVWGWTLVGFAFLGTRLFCHREVIPVIFSALIVVGVLHAAAGLYQQWTSPRSYLWGQIVYGNPFGAFVNRNNSGPMLLFGLTGCIGLVALRILRLIDRNDVQFFNSQSGNSGYPRQAIGGNVSSSARSLMKVSVVGCDLASIFAIICAGFIFVAIFASGSRGTLVAALIGSLVCFAIAANPRTFLLLTGGLVLTSILALLGCLQFNVAPSTVNRLGESGLAAIDNDARLGIWADALRASIHYFPLGSGMGTYQYAHLPFQESTPPGLAQSQLPVNLRYDYLPREQSGFLIWATHADSQWVEWAVEGGLWIALLLTASMALCISALYRLKRKPLAYEQALLVAGTFTFVSLMISQGLDSALWLLPNASLAALFASAIAATAFTDFGISKEPTFDSLDLKKGAAPDGAGVVAIPTLFSRWGRMAMDWRQPPAKQFTYCPSTAHRRFLRKAAVAFGLGLLMLGLFLNQRVAARHASTDTLLDHSRLYLRIGDRPIMPTREVDLSLRAPQTASELPETLLSNTKGTVDLALPFIVELPLLDSLQLAQLDSELHAQRSLDTSDPRLALELAALHSHILVTSGHLPTTIKTGNDENRSNHKLNEPITDPDEHLSMIERHSIDALRLCPFEDRARWNLVHVNLITGRRETVGTLLRQLAVLRPKYPAALLSISEVALKIEDWQLTELLWRKIVEMAPRRFTDVYRQWRRSPNHVPISQIIPDKRDVVIDAAQQYLNSDVAIPDRKLVSRALSLLDLPISKSERQLKAKLIEHEKSFEVEITKDE